MVEDNEQIQESGLTAKQEAFCNEYLIDLNATGAARRAGYSEHTASEIGWENLRKPQIQQRIAKLREEMSKGFNITKERIVQEYGRLAFFDIRKIHTVDGGLKPVTELDDDSAAAIAGIEVFEQNIPSDEPSEQIVVGKLKKIKIADKRAALDSLAKIMGYNAPEKHAFTDPQGNALPPLIVQPIQTIGSPPIEEKEPGEKE